MLYSTSLDFLYILCFYLFMSYCYPPFLPVNILIYSSPVRAAFPFLTAPRHGQDSLPRILGRIYVEIHIFVCEYAVIIFDLDNINLEDFGIMVIGRDKVVKGNTVIIDFPIM